MKIAVKGTFGYIDSKKRLQLLISLVLFSAVLIIFTTGYILNDKSKASYFTVLAILMVLPAAMMFVNYLILVPFHSISKNNYNEVVSRIKEGDTLYTDFVITSKQKIMYLSYLAISDTNVIGLLGREKEDLSYIENYLSTNIKMRGLPYIVTLFNDENEFLARLSSPNDNEESTAIIESMDNEKDLKAFLVSIMV